MTNPKFFAEASGITCPTDTYTKVIDLVKMGQRNNQDWKTMWIDWCQEHGNGVHDPTRHNPMYLIAFVLKFGLAEVGGFSREYDGAVEEEEKIGRRMGRWKMSWGEEEVAVEDVWGGR